MKHELEYLRGTQQDIYEFDRIVGSSAALQRVLDIVKKVAKSNTTVLIRGETGTGKELIAGATHHNSLRSARNFVKVNCAALQENLLESELFGHEKGRVHGRGQAAHRPLRTGRRRHAVPRRNRRHEPEHAGEDPARAPGARVRTAGRHAHAARRRAADRGHQPRPAGDGAGADSSARTSTTASTSSRSRCRRCASARTTSCRWRTSFIRRFAGELKKKIEGLDPDAQKLLMRYNWPGNIRELENTIERAMLLAEGRAIAADDLRLGEAPTPAAARANTPPSSGFRRPAFRSTMWNGYALIEALKMSNWVQKDAAELLSISPRVMNYKIKTLGIEFPRGRRAAPLNPVDSSLEPPVGGPVVVRVQQPDPRRAAGTYGFRDLLSHGVVAGRPAPRRAGCGSLATHRRCSGPAGAPSCTRRAVARRSRGCSAASCSDARGRAVPGWPAGPRRAAAGASRTSVAAHAG